MWILYIFKIKYVVDNEKIKTYNMYFCNLNNIVLLKRYILYKFRNPKKHVEHFFEYILKVSSCKGEYYIM